MEMPRPKTKPTIKNPSENEIEVAEALLLLHLKAVIHERPPNMAIQRKELQKKYGRPTQGPSTRHQNELRVFQRRRRRLHSGQKHQNQVEGRRVMPDLNLPWPCEDVNFHHS